MLFCFGLLLGLILGGSLEAYRWRSNAKQIYRIESFGHLYKVKLDDTYDDKRFYNEEL